MQSHNLDPGNRLSIRPRTGIFVMPDLFVDRYSRILGVTATAVYMSLCRHADRNRVCFPSQRLIGKELNITSRSVRAAIRRLKSASLIAAEHERTGHGRWRNNRYILLDRNQWKSPEEIYAPWTGGKKQPSPEENNDKTGGSGRPTKDAHGKDTHMKEDFDISPLNEVGDWLDGVHNQKFTSYEKNRNIPDDNVQKQLLLIRKELSKRLKWKNGVRSQTLFKETEFIGCKGEITPGIGLSKNVSLPLQESNSK